jgi:putative hydrolase of the HAD superfamily
VIFDLWETLVDWPREEAAANYAELAQTVGVEPARFEAAWVEARAEREIGPLLEATRSIVRSLGAGDHVVERVLDVRREHTRKMLRPRPGAVETLAELRNRGFRVGLISACSGDVPDVWPQTALAPLVEEPIFSCSVGFSKPDPRIYAAAAERLGVEPSECLFVGDGANDELAGAERAGMKAVLILRPGETEPPWEEARGWQPRITSIPEVLQLVPERPA